MALLRPNQPTIVKEATGLQGPPATSAALALRLKHVSPQSGVLRKQFVRATGAWLMAHYPYAPVHTPCFPKTPCRVEPDERRGDRLKTLTGQAEQPAG
jgi:hypothetical protein